MLGEVFGFEKGGVGVLPVLEKWVGQKEVIRPTWLATSQVNPCPPAPWARPRKAIEPDGSSGSEIDFFFFFFFFKLTPSTP